MAYTFDSTGGGSSTNSYATVAEFQDYVDSFLFTTEADELSTQHIQKLLTMAWRILDTQRYNGSKAASSQSAQFPRYGLIDWDGEAIGSSTIPTALKHAQIELAIYLLTEESRYVQEMMDYGKISNYSAGSMSIAYERAMFANGLPQRVDALLTDIGPNVWRKKNRNRRLVL